MLQLLKLLIQTQPLILRLLVQSRPLFGGEDPVMGKPWHHAKITWHAAEQAGWHAGDPPNDTWDEDTQRPTDESSAAAAIAWHADYLDSYLYNPLWWAAGIADGLDALDRFRAALLHQNDLIKLHFDDTTSTRQIKLLWARYLGGTVAGLLWAAERDDVDAVNAARNIVGTGLHALQDFYAHSNWVDDPARRDKTWLQLGPQAGATIDPRDALHLYAGAYEHEPQTNFKSHGEYAFDCAIMDRLVPKILMNAACSVISPLSNSRLCERWWQCRGAAPIQDRRPEVLGVKIPPDIIYFEPPGIALDSTWMAELAVQQRDLPDRGQPDATGEKMFGYARDLAQEHTKSWLKELDNEMASKGYEAFWKRVKTDSRTGDRRLPGPPELSNWLGRYDGDLEQYEEPRRTPFNFLTAGKYPPNPDGSDEGWFVRLDISTSDESHAGTDADIYAVVDGKPFLLDRMHERVPQGGLDEFRLLEHNDFEAGSKDTYVVGPFAQRPQQLALRNSAASAVDVVRAAWEDFKSWVSDVLDDLGDFLLSLTIFGPADRVGADKRTWSWDELEQISRTGPEALDNLRMWGGDRGIYQVSATLIAEASPTGVIARVKLEALYCEEESGVDWAGSDEPFVIALVHSPASEHTERYRTTGITNVDEGQWRDINHEMAVEVPRYGGLILAAEVWESDLDSIDARDQLRDEFASEFGARTTDERSKFLDALGRAILPDWKVATLDAYAFRRGEDVEVARLASNRQLNRWVDAGQTLDVPLYGTSLLSLREIARNNLGLTGGFSVVRDIFGVAQIVGTQSLRAKLENLMQ